jgi:hypothetical protein
MWLIGIFALALLSAAQEGIAEMCGLVTVGISLSGERRALDSKTTTSTILRDKLPGVCVRWYKHMA